MRSRWVLRLLVGQKEQFEDVTFGNSDEHFSELYRLKD